MLTCEACERLIVDALYDELDSAQQKKLDRHLESCRICRDLLAELQAAGRTLEQHGLTAGRFHDVAERAGLDELWDAMQPALDQVDAERYRHVSRRRFAPYLTGALAAAAGLLTLILLFDLGIQNGDLTLETGQPVATAEPSDAELLNYLRRAEAMLMAVANAQSRNEAGVPIRQNFARNMAQEAGVLTAGMEDSFSSGQSRLLKDIEYMLMQIANLEEGNMEEGVQLLQGYIEENNILFRIRLMEMRES